MIRHQDPGQAVPVAFGELPPQTRDEVAAVDVVVKDRAAFDPTQEYVVTDPCAIPASDPRHGCTRDRGDLEATSFGRSPQAPAEEGNRATPSPGLPRQMPRGLTCVT